MSWFSRKGKGFDPASDETPPPAADYGDRKSVV